MQAGMREPRGVQRRRPVHDLVIGAKLQTADAEDGRRETEHEEVPQIRDVRDVAELCRVIKELT